MGTKLMLKVEYGNHPERTVGLQLTLHLEGSWGTQTQGVMLLQLFPVPSNG